MFARHSLDLHVPAPLESFCQEGFIFHMSFVPLVGSGHVLLLEASLIIKLAQKRVKHENMSGVSVHPLTKTSPLNPFWGGPPFWTTLEIAEVVNDRAL